MAGVKRTGQFILGICLLFPVAGCGDDKDSGGEILCDDSTVVLDLPFNYTFESDYLAIHTPGGDLKTTIGPWGAHTQPYTGHPEGNAKSDWGGLFATSWSEMTELESTSPDGICSKGETCGVPAATISARIPMYVSPGDGFTVKSVSAEAKYPSAVNEFSGALQWRVEGMLCNYRFAMGHLTEIGPDLKTKMIAAGYSDPASFTDVTGNLITGDPIVLSKGESVAIPQIRVQEVSGHPGFYRGWGGVHSDSLGAN